MAGFKLDPNDPDMKLIKRYFPCGERLMSAVKGQEFGSIHELLEDEWIYEFSGSGELRIACQNYLTDHLKFLRRISEANFPNMFHFVEGIYENKFSSGEIIPNSNEINSLFKNIPDPLDDQIENSFPQALNYWSKELTSLVIKHAKYCHEHKLIKKHSRISRPEKLTEKHYVGMFAVEIFLTYKETGEVRLLPALFMLIKTCNPRIDLFEDFCEKRIWGVNNKRARVTLKRDLILKSWLYHYIESKRIDDKLPKLNQDVISYELEANFLKVTRSTALKLISQLSESGCLTERAKQIDSKRPECISLAPIPTP